MDAATTSNFGTSTPIRPLLHEVTGSGDPIVLMPGGLSGWIQWIDHAKRLAERHTVVRVQLRSVEMVEGGEPFPGDYTFAQERDGLLATVNALGLDRFDLVGWSSGGGAALAFAMKHPHRVRTLTLIEPAAMWILREAGHMTGDFRRLEAVDHSLAEREVTIDDLKAFLVNAGLGSASTTFEAHPRWPIWVRNRQALASNYAEWQHQESLADLRHLRVPILMVKGMETAGFLGAIVDDIVANAQHVTLLELPGGHACFLEHPDRFAEALEAHIAHAEAGSGDTAAEPLSS